MGFNPKYQVSIKQNLWWLLVFDSPPLWFLIWELVFDSHFLQGGEGEGGKGDGKKIKVPEL